MLTCRASELVMFAGESAEFCAGIPAEMIVNIYMRATTFFEKHNLKISEKQALLLDKWEHRLHEMIPDYYKDENYAPTTLEK